MLVLGLNFINKQFSGLSKYIMYLLQGFNVLHLLPYRLSHFFTGRLPACSLDASCALSTLRTTTALWNVTSPYPCLLFLPFFAVYLFCGGYTIYRYDVNGLCTMRS